MTDSNASLDKQSDSSSQSSDPSTQAYLDGTMSLESLVRELVDPINASYTSADSGQAILEAELSASIQRKYLEPAEAEELWGLPLPTAQLPSPLPKDSYDDTETELWGFWGSILDTARAIPWRDVEQQTKLIALIRALGSEPDPPPPTQMTKALSNNWIWKSGTLWSTLLMIGPSTREEYNLSRGCNMGFDATAVAGWTNLNAFMARVTAAGVVDFWIYAIWALRAALEDDVAGGGTHSEPAATPTAKFDAFVPAAAVWVLGLGAALYEREEDLTPTDPHHGDPGKPGELWERLGGKPEFNKARWAFWKERLGVLRVEAGLAEDTRDMAAKAYERMVEIEAQYV